MYEAWYLNLGNVENMYTGKVEKRYICFIPKLFVLENRSIFCFLSIPYFAPRTALSARTYPASSFLSVVLLFA